MNLVRNRQSDAQCSARGTQDSVLRSAYTLIEMLVVVTVLGIAGTLLIPHMVNRDSMTAQAAVRRVIGDLCFAQSDALAHQEVHQVHFYTSGHGYCIVREGPTAYSEAASSHTYLYDPLAGAGNITHYIVDFSTDQRFKGVTISSVAIDGNGRDINYDALGGTITASNLPGTGGSFIVANGTERYRIDISAFTGKLTVVKL